MVVAGIGVMACGGDGGEAAAPAATDKADQIGGGSVSIRGTVTQINESPTGDRTESIIVKADGQELTIFLGEEVGQSVWNPSHLEGHMFFGEVIGIVYKGENGELIAVALNE